MGSDRGDDDEKPVHSVTVSSFRICKYQVTQDDWKKIMGNNPSYFRSDPARGEDQWLRPVEDVSWFDAIEYCNRRSVVEGLTPCYTINGENVKCNWNERKRLQAAYRGGMGIRYERRWQGCTPVRLFRRLQHG